MAFSNADQFKVEAGGLSEFEERYCNEYVLDLNGSQAVKRSGYTGPHPRNKAMIFMKRTRVRSRIAELIEIRSQKMKIDAEWVLAQAVEVYNICVAKVEAKNADGIPLGYDSKGAIAILNVIGKHIDVQAFKKSVEHTGENGGPIVLWGNQSNALPPKRRPPRPPRRHS